MVHCCCGLFWHRPRARLHYVWYNLVPLINSNVEVTVIDQMTQVDITQTYVNNESFAIEASYIFPLDERAAVCGFEAEIAGNRIVGEAKEKQQAKREYDAAIARGDGAYLLEEEKADIFKVKVGNIPPGEKVAIKITYVAELKSEVGEMKKRFLLPTIVAPRYTPAPNWRQSESDRSLEQPMTGAGRGYDLSVNMTVVMMSDIVSIESPTHAISKSIQGSSASVGFAFGSVPMDKDVVVNIEVSQPHEPRVCVEENEGSLAAMVTLFPHIQFQDVPVEIIFVIDRSGSMGGGRIKDARDAMQLFMRALPEDCYFNIVGFGSRFEALFHDSQKYDDASLRTATGHIQKMDANLGGTELVRPLQSVFQKPPIRGYPRQVFVLTDGEVSNTDEVINLVRTNSHTSRVFSLGIGESVSHHLVEGIARAGKGTAQFVKGGPDMSVKVMKQLKEAIQPALQNIKINWGDHVQAAGSPAPAAPAAPSGAIVRSLLGYVSPQASAPPAPRVEVHQAPFEVPPIFDSQHFLIYGMYGNASLPATVTITAESPDGPLTVALPVDPSKKIVGKLIHTLAARAMIRDLEEGRSWMSKMGFNAQSPQVKGEIVRLGTKYQLASLYTSFIAVERRSGVHYDCWFGPHYDEPVHVPVPTKSSVKGRGGGGYGGPGSGGRGGGGGGGGGYARLSAVSASAAPPPSAPSASYSYSAAPPSFAASSYSAAPPSRSYEKKKKASVSRDRKSSFEGEKCKESVCCDFDEEEDIGVQCALADADSLSFAECAPSRSRSLSPRSSSSSSSLSAPSPVVSAGGSSSAILMEQSVNGSFALTAALASLLGTSVDLLRDVLANLQLGGGEAEKVVATAAVLVYLERRCGDQKDLWDLSANKARRYIEKQGLAKPLSEILQALSALF